MVRSLVAKPLGDENPIQHPIFFRSDRQSMFGLATEGNGCGDISEEALGSFCIVVCSSAVLFGTPPVVGKSSKDETIKAVHFTTIQRDFYDPSN